MTAKRLLLLTDVPGVLDKTATSSPNSPSRIADASSPTAPSRMA
jgi:acetylglutamate kinase